MIGTVVECDLDVDHVVAGEDAGEQRALCACVNSGNIFLRNGTAGDSVDELVALAGLVRLDLELDVSVLTGTAGLPLELVVDVCRLADGPPTLASTLNSRSRRSTIISR